MKKYSTKKIRYLLLAFTLACAAQIQGQDLAYTSGSTGADGPLTIPTPFISGLEGMAVAYDPVRDELVIFGGVQTDQFSNPAVQGMWTWDGVSFTEKTPATMPPNRHNAGMVWDSARNEIMMFGGRDDSTLLNDTWTWDGTNWTDKNPVTKPTGRWSFGMAFDAARSEVVMNGGAIGSPITNETWTWNGTNWTLETPSTIPGGRFQHGMAYDAARGEVIMFGGRFGQTILAETWTWNGTNWSERSPGISPSGVIAPTMVYDAGNTQVVLFGGSATVNGNTVLDQVFTWNGSDWTEYTDGFRPSKRYFAGGGYDTTDNLMYLIGGEDGADIKNDVWTFDGTDWSSVTGNGFTIDMRDKPNGVWNYTTIDIPAGVTVEFLKNDANSPVVWLATGNVNIVGSVNLDGKNGGTQTNAGDAPGPLGGPGGFRGGVGGVRLDISGSHLAQPGAGPGGGTGGVSSGQDGGDAVYAGFYGNPLVDPLIGGSGGGGEASSTTVNGDNGGGGGGAILIASSLDITVNGSITAKGGEGNFAQGGHGSGGAIVLVADRLLGVGTLDSSGAGGDGRVRLEGFERPLAEGSITVPVVGFPFAGRDFTNPPSLLITSVDGGGVPAAPLGDFNTPDVSVSAVAPINVVVTAQNIPDGEEVELRVTSGGTVTTLPSGGDPAVTLAGGTATFSVTLPSGIGTLQATSEFMEP